MLLSSARLKRSDRGKRPAVGAYSSVAFATLDSRTASVRFARKASNIIVGASLGRTQFYRMSSENSRALAHGWR